MAAAAEVEKDYSTYLDKAPTDMQDRFRAWIEEVVGYNPATAKTKAEAFAEGARLATALRMDFQSSPENQEHLAARKAEIEAERAARAAKPKRKTRKPKATDEVDEDTDDTDEEEAPAPAPKRRGRKPAAKKPEPAPEVEEDDDDEEPEEDAPAPKRRTRKAAAPRATGARRTRAAKGDAAPF